MYRLITLLLWMLAGQAQAVESLSVQALFGNKAMLLIDGERHTLAVGQTSPQGVKLVSVSPQQAVLQVDGKQSAYTLGSSVSLDFRQRPSVSETLYADDRGMFRTVGTINGQTVELLVDTGATLIAMNTTQAKRLGIRYRLDGKPAQASTASGYVKGYRVRLRSVTVGNIRRKNVEAMVIDGKHPGPILLGMSFLDALKVEKAGNVLTFEQRR